jgi:hypothetical protein
VPDQNLITDDPSAADHISATRGDDYLFVYSPVGRGFTVRMGKISGARVNGFWYNPRDGASAPLGSFENTGTREFVPPSEGFGSDWVLILDDASRGFAAPGARRAAPDSVRRPATVRRTPPNKPAAGCAQHGQNLVG